MKLPLLALTVLSTLITSGLIAIGAVLQQGLGWQSATFSLFAAYAI